MTEFDKKLIAEYLAENWAKFLAYIAQYGLTEEDAERLVEELENHG